MEFSLTEHDLNLLRLLGLIAIMVMEVLGFKAVTSPGKIYHFIELFFKKQIDRKEYCKPEGNKHMDDILLMKLPKGFTEIVADNRFPHVEEQYVSLIEKQMKEEELYSDDDSISILINLARAQQNKYWFYRKVNKYPSWVVDPIVGCPTCMPSVHTLIVYTLIVFVQGWHWNPFIWIGVALCCTFITEMLWKSRSIVDKINKKLDKQV